MAKDLGKVGQEQFDRVMNTFERGRLRDPSGDTITNRRQAEAVAFSEGRKADRSGVVKRTFKGRTRLRPPLKGK